MPFDYVTAADLCCGRNVTADKAAEFAYHARCDSDNNRSLGIQIAELRREIALRESEIALIKGLLIQQDSPEAPGRT